MNGKSLAVLLLGGMLAASAMAESPGPTDPSGPRLEPPSSPRSGTENTRKGMDEQIERGTLIDRKDVLDERHDKSTPAPDENPDQRQDSSSTPPAPRQ